MEKTFICPLILNRNHGTYLLLLFGLDGSLFILPSQCTFGTRMQYPILLAPIFGSLPEVTKTSAKSPEHDRFQVS